MQDNNMSNRTWPEFGQNYGFMSESFETLGKSDGKSSMVAVVQIEDIDTKKDDKYAFSLVSVLCFFLCLFLGIAIGGFIYTRVTEGM